MTAVLVAVMFSRVCAWVEADHTELFKDRQTHFIALGKYHTFFFFF